jgi:CPA1 family monovalent cation:H+ antiporter
VLAELDGDHSPFADTVRDEFAAHLGAAEGESEQPEAEQPRHRDVHARALRAARQAVLAMRSNEEIGDDAFHRLEEELDWIEMSAGG